MAADRFDLVSDWHVAAPPVAVWAELNTPEAWPEWWRAVKRVEALDGGDAKGVGSARRFTWTSALPYRLTFDMVITRIEPVHIIEGRARGELNGLGRWTITPDGEGTHVRYDWQVELGKPWQRALAPLLRPAFSWNHRVVMGWGYQGLCRRLGIAPQRRR